MMNWKIAPFDDVNARKAFCLAINRDQINQQVYQGRNMPTWHLVPKGMNGYNSKCERAFDGVAERRETPH